MNLNLIIIYYIQIYKMSSFFLDNLNSDLGDGMGVKK